MKKISKYILVFLISGILLLIALSIDNMLWVTASPEWENNNAIVYQAVFGMETGRYWVGPVKNYDAGQLFNYLIGYRIVTVWTNLRDIGAAIIVGFLVVVSLMIRDKIKLERFKRRYD